MAANRTWMVKLGISFVVVISLPGAMASSAHAGIITTTFDSDNTFDGNMFNATVFGKSLTVNSIEINVVGTISQEVSVYTKAGTYVGFETNAAAWTLVSKTTFLGKGTGNPTLVDIADFVLPANATTGIYITLNPDQTAPFMNYTVGTTSVSNSDLKLDLGAGLGGLFGSEFLTSNRIWNGTINYQTAIPEPTSFALVGVAALLGGCYSRRRAGFIPAKRFSPDSDAR